MGSTELSRELAARVEELQGMSVVELQQLQTALETDNAKLNLTYDAIGRLPQGGGPVGVLTMTTDKAGTVSITPTGWAMALVVHLEQQINELVLERVRFVRKQKSEEAAGCQQQN
ncbi:MAG: hypothetical protein AAFQ71_11485 [Planctomycetota bacterium]